MKPDASTNLVTTFRKMLGRLDAPDAGESPEPIESTVEQSEDGESGSSLTVQVEPVGAVVILQTVASEPDEIDEVTVPTSGIVKLHRPDPTALYRVIVCGEADSEHFDECVEPDVSELKICLQTFRCEVNFKTNPGATITVSNSEGTREMYGPVDSSGELCIDSISEGDWVYEISLDGHRTESGFLNKLRRGDSRPPLNVRLHPLPIVEFKTAPGAHAVLQHAEGWIREFGPVPENGVLIAQHLPEGDWIYELKLEHHESVTGKLEGLKAGTQQVVDGVLTPRPGWLKLRTGRWEIWHRDTRLGVTREKIELAQGDYQLLLIDEGSRSLILPVKIKSGCGRSYTESEAREFKPADASRDLSWPNSLGMRFAPLTGRDVLFSIWPTRVKDYAVFAEDMEGLDESWKEPLYDGVAIPGGADHPVVCVNWVDATAFCRWLTLRDRTAGLISVQQSYRLARDWEWSVAVGLKEPRNGSPEDKDRRIPNVYPWGVEWPPSEGAGNYADASAKDKFPGWSTIYGYRDGHVATSPVGSFKPNALGFYDLGGNCWEWVEDEYGDGSGARVLRGASLYGSNAEDLASSARNCCSPDYRDNDFGFRVVLANGSGK